MKFVPRVACAAALLAVVLIAAGAGAQTSPDTTGVSTPVTTPIDTAAVVPPPAPPSQVTVTAPPQEPQNNEAGMFSKGRRRVSGTVGWGSSFGSDYLLVGLGVGYFIRNGIDVGLDFEGWFLGDPTMYKVSPRVDYVMWRSPRLKPYVGAFYRWNFISDFDDQSSIGGRAGAFYKGTRGGMAGAGVVYERFMDDKLPDRDVIYPEVFVAVSF